MVVYKTTNIINNRYYVGKDKYNNPSYLGSGKILKQAIDKYGKDNFRKEILEICNETNIDEREKYWIAKLRTNESYNIAVGGEGGDVFTYHPNKEEYRKKLSIGSKKSNARNIEIHRKNTTELWKTDEYRNKVMKKMKEAMDNDEYRKKLSDGVKKHLENPENLKIWSECKKGSKNGRWLGKIKVTDVDGNSVMYETAVDVHNKLCITAHGVREHCRNGTTYKRGIYKGWKFEFCEVV